MKQKPATLKAWAMREKLEALVARGVEGERLAAQVKLDRLLMRYDFTKPRPATTADLFAGKFQPGPDAHPIGVVEDRSLAAFVLWAVENRTGLRCRLRGAELIAEAAPETAARLNGIVQTIARGFSELWELFSATPGVLTGDRALFMRGLYDGMMEDVLSGAMLPPRVGIHAVKRGRGKKLVPAPAMSLHPYSVAVGLGRQIMLTIPLMDTKRDLETTLAGAIEN